MTTHAPAIVFLGGVFAGALGMWIVSGLCNATAMLARDREDKLLASVKEMQFALLEKIDRGEIDGLGTECGDMIERADWVQRYCEESR